jgi:hypothetical protein
MNHIRKLALTAGVLGAMLVPAGAAQAFGATVDSASRSVPTVAGSVAPGSGDAAELDINDPYFKFCLKTSGPGTGPGSLDNCVNGLP